MRYILASALALGAFSTPAFAQEAAASFTGPRAEVVAGWDHVKNDGDKKSGVTYGFGAGYDTAFGNVVLGAEAELTGATTEKCAATATIKGCFQAGRDIYAGGRIGYAFSPKALVYGKVGYTNARVSAELDSNTSLVTRAGDNLDGIRLGAGVETTFGKFLGKIEYRYSNYADNYVRHQVVAGLGVRF